MIISHTRHAAGCLIGLEFSTDVVVFVKAISSSRDSASIPSANKELKKPQTLDPETLSYEATICPHVPL